MLVNTKKIFEKANKEFYAIGAFNVSNIEMINAIVAAAEEEKSPVILQISEKAIAYAGLEQLAAAAKIAASNARVPVAIHLDHGSSAEIAKKCIEAGFTSVMIDMSHQPFKENVQITKEVVKLAKKKNVSVEAEIGVLGGIEDNVKSDTILLTDPKEAFEFAEKTKIDSLAVAVGTSHGAYKFKCKPELAIDRITEIKKLTKLPLVLHGASGVPKQLLDKAKKYGAKLKDAQGVPDEQIKKAIAAGINKVNIDTDTRLAFTAAVREFLATNKENFDPREILSHASEAIKQNAKEKIRLFGSSGKA